MTRFGPKEITVDGIAYTFVNNCPCGLAVYANTENSAILHVKPECEKFKELDALAFVQWMRRSKGIPDSMLEEEN